MEGELSAHNFLCKSKKVDENAAMAAGLMVWLSAIVAMIV